MGRVDLIQLSSEHNAKMEELRRELSDLYQHDLLVVSQTWSLLGAGQTCLSLEKLRLDCHCSVSVADLVDVRHALAMKFSCNFMSAVFLQNFFYDEHFFHK
ncbi:hypothetical protein MKX03_026981, partial [Papaver bracteatum]